MLHCHDCFHNCVCGNSSPHNDVSMCKQFLNHIDVVHGNELDRLNAEINTLRIRVRELRVELKAAEFENKDLEDEVKLLRIIKQTLEMQAGMKFDI